MAGRPPLSQTSVSLPPPPVEDRVYYSPVRNLVICVSAGKPAIEPITGGRIMVDEKIAEFANVGNFGRFVTSDTECIAEMEKRVASGAGDVISAEEYVRRITPPEVREAELRRTLTENNGLIEDYKMQLLEKERQIEALTAAAAPKT